MVLQVKKRELTGKKVTQLRRENQIPASIYGPDTKPVNAAVNYKNFRDLFKEVGYSKLFDLQLEEQPGFKALVKEVQVNPVTDQVIHVSFYQIDQKREIHTEIPVVITGTSLAVKNNLGLLVEPVNTLPVRCLPKDLPSEIRVDVSNLNEIGDGITLKDIKLPEGVSYGRGIDDATVLAYIATPQKTLKEEEEEAAAKAAAEAEARGETLEPAEGEEGAEGAAAEGTEGAEGAKGEGAKGAAAGGKPGAEGAKGAAAGSKPGAPAAGK